MDVMMNNVMKKRTSKGRQRTEMKKIEKRSSLQVTFSKRRQGLFKKAAQLSLLTGADVAAIVTSPAGKVFAFGSPSPDSVFHRFLSPIRNPNHATIACNGRMQPSIERNRKLEVEKDSIAAKEKCDRGEPFWWEEDVSGLGLPELEEFAAALEVLQSRVMDRAHHMEATERFKTEACDFPWTCGVTRTEMGDGVFCDDDVSDFVSTEDLLALIS